MREVAAAAGLSVPRIKQITAQGRSGAAHAPVTDVDLAIDPPGDRVFSLEEAAPWLSRWATEREFIESDHDRRWSRYDITHRVVDLDPGETWTVTWIADTREVYAFSNMDNHPYGGRPDGHPSDVDQSSDPSLGSDRGPCFLLGHLPTLGITEAAIDPIVPHIAHRPGGLALLHGRVQLVNRILKAATEPLDDLFGPGHLLLEAPIWTYLRDLPERERP